MSKIGAISRRRLAGSLFATSVLGLAPRIATARSPSVRSRSRAGGPKKLVIFDLYGGIDNLYTIDPKEHPFQDRNVA